LRENLKDGDWNKPCETWGSHTGGRLWDVTPCSLVDGRGCVWGNYWRHFQGWNMSQVIYQEDIVSKLFFSLSLSTRWFLIGETLPEYTESHRDRWYSSIYTRFEVFTAAAMKITLFCNATPCSLME
jgi:hypothetical protein